MTNKSELPKQNTETFVQMNVQVPESLKLDAKEIGLYLGLNLSEFVIEAIKEKVSSHDDIKVELLTARRDRIGQRLAELTAVSEFLDDLKEEQAQTLPSDS